MSRRKPGKKKDKAPESKRTKYVVVGLLSAAVLAALVVLLLSVRPSGETRRLARVRAGEEELNVILISVDTLRADYCGCYGSDAVETPNIDGLAAGGTMFEGCWVQVPLTLPSHTTILTGTTPIYHGVAYNTSHVPADIPTLAELTGEAGYATAAFIGGFPLDDIYGLDRGFDLYDDRFSKGVTGRASNYETPANKVWARASEWLDGLDGDRFFLFVHFYDPHTPYEPPVPYSNDFKDNLYAGEVKFVDDVVGVMLEQLEAKGLRDNTLLVFLSDHGEALGGHGESEHGYFIYDEDMRVPLIFNCPGLIPAGKKVGGSVRLTDVLPTVTDVLGIETPADVQGESLVPYIYGRGEPEGDVYMESRYATYAYGWASLFGLQKDRWKYIDAPEPELYDLGTDPAEENNLVDVVPNRAAEMAEELSALMERLTRAEREQPADADLTVSDVEKLAALGYVSLAGGARTPVLPDVDPKDKIEFHELMNEFQQSRKAGRAAEADAIFRKLATMEPDLAFVKVQQAILLKMEGRYGEAMELLESAVESNPYDETPIIEIADIYIQTGRYEEGRSLLKGLAEDRNTTTTNRLKAYSVLGMNAFEYGDDPEEAKFYLEKVVETDEEYAPAYYFLTVIYAREPGRTKEVIKYAEAYLALEPRGNMSEQIRNILEAYK
jgi:arylsulfatase A-like enzyme